MFYRIMPIITIMTILLVLFFTIGAVILAVSNRTCDLCGRRLGMFECTYSYRCMMTIYMCKDCAASIKKQAVENFIKETGNESKN